MVIIKVKGRLGNQMFDYALYKKFQKIGKQVSLDFSQLYIDNIKNELKIFENIDYTEAIPEDINKLGDCKKDILSKVRRKLGWCKKTHIYEKEMKFDDNIFGLDDAYLEGFWQSEKYFADIREQLINDFKFTNIEKVNNYIISQITQNNSVSK